MVTEEVLLAPSIEKYLNILLSLNVSLFCLCLVHFSYYLLFTKIFHFSNFFSLSRTSLGSKEQQLE
jgi:hypothetical protein